MRSVILALLIGVGTAHAVSITPLKAILSGKPETKIDLVFKIHGGSTAENIALIQLDSLTSHEGKVLTKTVLSANSVKSIPVTFRLTEDKKTFICATLLPKSSEQSSASFVARTCSSVLLTVGSKASPATSSKAQEGMKSTLETAPVAGKGNTQRP